MEIARYRPPRPELARWVDDGEVFLAEVVAGIPGGSWYQPSKLPGWSRASVVAHLARNADALSNLLWWAGTGIETPMYESAEQRDAAIAVSARQAPDDLLRDLDRTSYLLAALAARLRPEHWEATVRTSRGRPVPATEVLWLRLREVWIHAVDLDAGATFEDLPEAIAAALLGDVRADLAARNVADLADLTRRAGSDAQLLGWLTGRAAAPATTRAAELPAWL